MPAPAVPPSWRVSQEDNGDGTVTVRYAYRDGTAANLVLYPHMLEAFDDLTLAGLVKRPPPPPSPKA